MKYELMSKGVQVLTEVTNKPEKNVAEEINNFYTSPAMKATGWILLSLAVVVVLGIGATILYKKHKEKQFKKYNNNKRY